MASKITTTEALMVASFGASLELDATAFSDGDLTKIAKAITRDARLTIVNSHLVGSSHALEGYARLLGKRLTLA